MKHNIQSLSDLQFCFLHALSILCHGKGINHFLNVSTKKSRKVVSGETDSMVGNATLWEVICADFCRAITGRNEALSPAGNIVKVFLMFLIIDICTQA